MKIYKIIAFVYLAFAIVFAYDAYTKFTQNQSYWLSLFFVAIAIFMFVFRMKNANKFSQKK